MNPIDKQDDTSDGQRFVRQATEPQTGFLREFWLFLRDNKKWWLTPLLIVLLTFGALVVLGGTAVAPFIYTLF